MAIATDIFWSDEWLIGHKSIDDEHQELVRIIRRMQAAPLVELDSLLTQFQLSAKSHFEVENQLMEASQFPPRKCHIDEHDAVLKSVAEVRALLRQDKNLIARELVKELAKWFPAHVVHLDSALSHWLSKQSNGGKPVVIKRALNLLHE